MRLRCLAGKKAPPSVIAWGARPEGGATNPGQVLGGYGDLKGRGTAQNFGFSAGLLLLSEELGVLEEPDVAPEAPEPEEDAPASNWANSP
jgi:hypothetical protein